MLYEDRRVLVGFRLKLMFDSTLRRNNACVYVEISKTPVISSLLNNIIESFKLPHGCQLTIQDCVVLPSESIHVLHDVNSVTIIAPTSLEKIELNNLNANSHTTKVAEQNEPCDGYDMVDGMPEKLVNKVIRTRKPYAREGIASTIKRLLEEENMNNIGEGCSGLSISHASETKNKKTEMECESVNVVEHEYEMVQKCDETSDLNSEIFEDLNLNLDKKRRKRKRKHSKKHVIEQPESTFKSESNCRSSPIREEVTRKHIRFDNTEENASHVSLGSTVLSVLELSNMMDISNASASEASIISNDLNNACNQDTTILQTEKQPTNVSTIRESLQVPFNFKADSTRPKYSISNHCVKTTKANNAWNINAQANSENSASLFKTSLSKLPFIKIEPKSNCDRLDNELSTLLMCKQLNTCMEYTVKYPSRKGNGCEGDVFIKPQSSKNNIENGSNYKEYASVTTEEPSLSVANDISADLTNSKFKFAEVNGRKCPLHSSNDCEVMMQVKLDGTKIRLRNEDDTWTLLTKEIASAKLPDLLVPEENQSIVFRIMYINQNYSPAVSNLLYGQITNYEPDTNELAVVIPPAFIKNIVSDCGEELFPDALVPISGMTYRIHMSKLIEPKLIATH